MATITLESSHDGKLTSRTYYSTQTCECCGEPAVWKVQSIRVDWDRFSYYCNPCYRDWELDDPNVQSFFYAWDGSTGTWVGNPPATMDKIKDLDARFAEIRADSVRNENVLSDRMDTLEEKLAEILEAINTLPQVVGHETLRSVYRYGKNEEENVEGFDKLTKDE